MIKYFCDKCGKELDSFNDTISFDTFKVTIEPPEVRRWADDAETGTYILCYDCVRKFNKWIDRKTEPQYDVGAYADRLWKIAYERGKREALEQTEPQTTDYCDVCNHKGCDNCVADGSDPYCVPSNYKPKTEPQTCSVNGRPYSECSSCEHFRCTADEPQTERSE